MSNPAIRRVDCWSQALERTAQAEGHLFARGGAKNNKVLHSCQLVPDIL